ncbi:ABC transporter ATP-binding protein [Pseudomonas cichorii]|uniref:ABC transporter ATP-binding protein n=2 Tax=Pseudomonas cichorii TaxID=36746 RepID=A0A3M4M7C3_PSECI|nr:ABC transporter ATP-binding protein [Pseudomonas cichorii]
MLPAARPGFCRPRPCSACVTGSGRKPMAESAMAVRAGRIQIQNVGKRFGNQEVLRNIDLSIEPGKVTVILGPSGSGKSTLLRTINHLEKIDSGHITIDGEYVGYRRKGNLLYELKESEILKQRVDVGFVFQNFNLFPHLTAWENIAEAPLAHKRWSKSEARSKALELLAKVGLQDKADAYPRQLSGGQQQRVAIARALALDPKVLLFDEPTSALDPELVGEVLDVIKGLTRLGVTLVVVTHEIGFAREVADHVVFLCEGQLIEQGPPEQLFRQPRHPRTIAFLGKVL